MKVYRTGIVPFDVQIEGGIPGGTVLLVLEEPGAGGDVFSYHFAVEGANAGEKIVYVSTDDYEKDVKRSINLYFERHVEFPIISFRGHKEERDPKGYLRRVVYDFLGRTRSIFQNEKFDRAVINNLMFFFARYPFEEVISTIELFSEISKENDSVFLLLMTKGMLENKEETAVKHYCDGVIELTLREFENEIQRRLKFIKLEGVVIPKMIMRYDITKSGIRMESTIRVL